MIFLVSIKYLIFYWRKNEKSLLSLMILYIYIYIFSFFWYMNFSPSFSPFFFLFKACIVSFKLRGELNREWKTGGKNTNEKKSIHEEEFYKFSRSQIQTFIVFVSYIRVKHQLMLTVYASCNFSSFYFTCNFPLFSSHCLPLFALSLQIFFFSFSRISFFPLV